jgi:hypothetical protein
MRLVPMPTYPVPLMLSPLPDVFLFALELRAVTKVKYTLFLFSPFAQRLVYSFRMVLRYKSEVHAFSLVTICTTTDHLFTAGAPTTGHPVSIV